MDNSCAIDFILGIIANYSVNLLLGYLVEFIFPNAV